MIILLKVYQCIHKQLKLQDWGFRWPEIELYHPICKVCQGYGLYFQCIDDSEDCKPNLEWLTRRFVSWQHCELHHYYGNERLSERDEERAVEPVQFCWKYKLSSVGYALWQPYHPHRYYGGEARKGLCVGNVYNRGKETNAKGFFFLLNTFPPAGWHRVIIRYKAEVKIKRVGSKPDVLN